MKSFMKSISFIVIICLFSHICYSKNSLNNKVNNSYTSIAKQFLSHGCQFLNSSGESSVTKMNLDNDNSNELVALFKNDSTFETGFFILKQINKKWHKIYQDCNVSSKISKFVVLDNKPKNLEVSYTSNGSTMNEYYLYSFDKDSIKKTYLGTYNKLEFLNNKLKLKIKDIVYAVEEKDSGIGCINNIIAYNGQDFSYANELMPNYFKKSIHTYKKMLKQDLTNTKYWYCLVDNELKANLQNKALKAINKLQSIIKTNKCKDNVIKNYKINMLKQICFNKLEKYEDAKQCNQDIVNELSKAISSEKLKLSGSVVDFYLMNMENDLSNSYNELSKTYTGLNNYEKAKENLEIAYKIKRELIQEGYFGTSDKITQQLAISEIKKQDKCISSAIKRKIAKKNKCNSRKQINT